MINQLEELVNQSYNKLYAYAFRMIGNHHDTEDVLQNAILRAWTKIDQFQENSKLLTWLYRIITNECYRFFEKIDKLPLIRITEDLGVSESIFFEGLHYTPEFDDALIMDEMREKCLQAFLKCMSKNQRVCFLLKTCLDLKNHEIGEIMDISVENVKVTLFRARKHLKSLFEMRCSLIDPEKPCKCHLWIKFMKDNNLPMPSNYKQPKMDLLKQEHFKNLTLLKKIDYLYTVEAKYDKDEFIENLKKLTEIL